MKFKKLIDIFDIIIIVSFLILLISVANLINLSCNYLYECYDYDNNVYYISYLQLHSDMHTIHFKDGTSVAIKKYKLISKKEKLEKEAIPIDTR